MATLIDQPANGKRQGHRDLAGSSAGHFENARNTGCEKDCCGGRARTAIVTMMHGGRRRTAIGRVLLRKMAITATMLIAFMPGNALAKGFFSIVTKEPEPLIKWYEAAFGTQLVRTVELKDRGITVFILDAPEVTIEIQHRADAIQHPERANLRTGIMKTGFAVPAIEPWLERWRSMKARIIAGPFDDDKPPMRSVVLLDPDGNSIHVMAPRKN